MSTLKVQIFREEDLRNWIGKDTFFFKLVDYTKVERIEVERSLIFRDFKEHIAERFQVEVPRQRFWLFSAYQKLNARRHELNRWLSPDEEALTMARLGYHFKRRQIKLFLEELLPPNTLAAPVAAASPRSPGRVLLLFFKLYVPEAKELEQLYAGMLKVNNTWRPRDIVSQLNQMVGFSPDERVTLYKERDGDPEHSCAAFNMEYSFSNFRLHNGSIIWFQKTSSFQHWSLYQNATVPLFFRSLYNREEVYFVPIGKINKQPKMLLLSKEHTFTEVLFKLAKKLKWADPSKIWLTAKTRSGPAQHPIEFRPLLLLADLLTGPNKHGNGIFYYEKRGRSIPEWPGLCPLLDVAFCYADKLNEVKNYQISLPKYSRIAELTREIMTQAGLPYSATDIWLFQAKHGEILNIFKASDYILDIVDVQDSKLCAHEA